MNLSRQEKNQIIEEVVNYPKAHLDSYFRGRFLYITQDGQPLCRLEYADNNLWYFAIYRWSTERYAKDEFGFNQKPMPLMEQIEFAARIMP